MDGLLECNGRTTARRPVPEEVIKHVGAPLYYRLVVLGEALTPEAADLAAAATAVAARAGVFVRR